MTSTDLRSPWLVAVWPGMGGVAHLAGAYLVEKLGARPAGVLEADGHFDLQAIDVAAGLVKPVQLPRGHFFAWRDPRGVRDLLLFVGDQQPQVDGYRYCEALVERAKALGVTRVFTFAAIASEVHPQAEPRVQVAATEAGLLADLRERGAEAMPEGRIAGLNGVLLAAAAARGIEAACLLGEMPFFAAEVPNPKASRAILRLFCVVAGIPLDLSALDAHAELVEGQLVAHLDALQKASETLAERVGQLFGGARPAEAEAEADGPEFPAPDTGIEPEVEARIEALFRAAGRDRSRARELKALLDEHDLFRRFEDRFLDLFRKAG